MIQGLTEFLPVSSSGHLRIAESFVGGISQPLTLELALHVGTLASVLLFYRREISGLLRSLFDSEDTENRLLVTHIVVASVPTAILGLGLKKAGVEHLGVPVVGACLLVTAAWNESTAHTAGGTTRISLGRALAIGVVQGVAVLPGISRSGSTIAAAMALGVPASDAFRFSFLCSIPAVGGATLLLFKDVYEGQLVAAQGPLAAGVVASFLVGYACLRLLEDQLLRGSFRLWAVYCALAAALILGRFAYLQGAA